MTNFDIFPIVFFIIFALIFLCFFVIITITLIRNGKQGRLDRKAPVLSVNATLIAKRADYRHYHNQLPNNNMHNTATTYFCTFEVESGDRIELYVPNTEYGLLIEGDVGKLTFQGTRYLSFVR